MFKTEFEAHRALIKKEVLRMTKKLSILKNKKDGFLTLSYAGIDLSNYKHLTINEFVEEVENADTWDFVGSEIYRKAFEEMGLDYDSYDDPDEMWEDFLAKGRRQTQGEW